MRIAASLPFNLKSRNGVVATRTARNLSVTLAGLAALAALAAGSAQAQTGRRCDLQGRDTTLTGNPTTFKRCLDLTGLNNQIVTVPLNVTRIDNDGLSLCKGSVQAGGDVDIVYVYDNSGSMNANLAYINTTTNDTTYYESDANCGDKTRNATQVKFYYWNTTGTLFDQSRTVDRLNSNTGCTEFAGDPYQTRARAYYLGIKDQALRAPLSTAGILSFSGSTAHRQLPLKLNTAGNVTTVVGAIHASNDGGTAYRPPTDTAKAWLTTGSITSNPKKAIIFLSDGKPKDDNPAWAGPSSGMPPIYGIFLGRPRADTISLFNMSQSTNGKFYLIPPDDPDSLKAVIAKILNIVLLEYEPQTAVVTNSSLAPAQSATSAPADFSSQIDGSWLMKLSDVIGLKRNFDNAISVTTTFKEKTSGATDTKTITFTLSTKAAESGTTQKIGTTQFGMTCYDKSSLLILNGGGARLGFFTDTNFIYQLRVRTAPTPMDSVVPAASTGVKADAETPKLKPKFLTTADSIVFKNNFTFAVIGGAKTAGNGILESSIYDSILVSWTHPRDAQDTVSDLMRVRATAMKAQIWFSLTNGGPLTNQYPANATNVFVVIKDQVPNPGKTYTAVITSETFNLDKETVVLTELTPGSGTLVAQLPISNIAKAPGDNKLEVSVGGDQLRVTYKDPMDPDSNQATAGFAQNVQESPSLEFTDASGTALPTGDIWSPASGKLYFAYSDDDVDGNITTKQVTLTLVSRKYGAAIGTDHEKVATSFTTNLSSSRGLWKGSIDLADAFPPADSNGKAETRFRGEATISVAAHDNVGAADGNTATDFLVIAYPDSQATITWKMDTTVVPKTNEGLIITVNDQTFTVNAKDTVLVSVACTKSGDSVANFPAGEGPTATSGIYTSGTLVKDEAVPNLNDKILSCLTTDQIRIRYVDPVYGTLTELIIDEVAKPTADPAGRKFVSSELVTLSTSTAGATIWYTTDGSVPVPGSATIYTDPIRINVTTVLKAIATKPGFKNSKVMTENYTKEFVASRLEILDENGNAIPGGSITGAATAVRIKLVTTQDNLTSTQVNAGTKVAGDAESIDLENTGSLGNSVELSALVQLRSPKAKTVDNDSIEASGTDTLIVTWQNPFDANDKASDTLFIKPAFVAAEVYFSATENGPKITEYPVNQDTVFIVVKTRPRDPSMSYTVVLTSSDGSGDREIVNLTELSPGVFSGKAPVGTGAKAKGDNTIQVAAAGDQLTAVFTDPVYKTDYRGDAGFAQGVQEAANLDFIDETGALLAPTDVWSPVKGKVYVRFSDDWNAGIDGIIQNKTVRFTLVNKKAGDQIGTDEESLIITLKSHTATRGIWEGSLTLQDKSTATNNNNVIEAYYRGELHAAVSPHNNAGGPAPGGDVTDDLVIAYPNLPAEIIITDNKGGGAVERKTDKVDIVIRDQQVTKSGDATINAMVACAQSGDKVAQVTLVWDATLNAYVIQPPLNKGEVTGTSVDKNDALLLCRDADVLTVTYNDPVFNDTRTADVKWSDPTEAKMYYGSTKDGSPITSVSDAVDKDFTIFIEGKSPTTDKVDTIEVVLTTAQGEKETFKAIETGPFTGKFQVKAEFRFQSGDPAKENGKLEGKITVANRVNQVLVNGMAVISGSEVKADLSMLSTYDLVTRAYIKDEDRNGKADHAYFLFDHKLSRLPTELPEVFWNQVGTDFKQKASSVQLSFKDGDSSIVMADFSKSEFGLGLTGIPDGKEAPYGRFPDDNLFAGQKAALSDSVGPVPLTAVKRPSNGLTYNVTDTERRFNPDTLVITVSEKLKTSTSFLQMIRFSKGCKDYKESVPLKLFSQPEFSADGLTITLIVDNSLETQTPFVDDCLFLEGDGRYTDLLTNLPGTLGAPLKGADPRLIIRAFRGFPPVAGIDAGNPGFVVSTNDPRNGTNSDFSKPNGGDAGYEVIWIPPAGFDPSDPVGSLDKISRDFNNPAGGERTGELGYPRPMPTDISTVQVITSTAYQAKIMIFDNLGHFVREMNQSFGHNGELRNRLRTVEGGQVSFLVWDMKDYTGAKVGQGVFVWKVNFTFTEVNKKSEVRYTRTGVLRR